MIKYLEVGGLKKAWEDFTLEISFEAAEGEFLSILGPSGSGKTSLLRLLAGLEEADSGRIVLSGRDISALPPEKRGIGMVFQDLALFPFYDVRGNVAYGLKAKGIKGRDLAMGVDEALERVGLSGFARRKIEGLSGGERQRVALARSLAINPSVILLDEPLSSLDRPLRNRLRGEMRACLKEASVLAILVTHDRNEAFEVSDRILLMRAGRIVDSGTPEELKNGGSHPFTSEFLGGD
jgi:ABC-type Fe3+/spermidine/putrescine transport system ATPase subunit